MMHSVRLPHPPAARSYQRLQLCSKGAREDGFGGDRRRHAPTSGGSSNAWNDNGDLAGKTDTSTSDLTTYDYDAMGYLRSVVLPDGTLLEYEWDAEGHRIGKSRDGVPEKGWLYRDDLQVVAELDGAGTITKRFIYAEGVNVPELMITGGATYRLVKDHLGSVRLVVNVATGAIAQRIDYDAWGRVLTDSNPGFTPFSFAGGLEDLDAAILRFGRRDYDPFAGRWSVKDPIRFAAGNNLYTYVRNRPLSLRDPSGLVEIAIPVGPAFGFAVCIAGYWYFSQPQVQQGIKDLVDDWPKAGPLDPTPWDERTYCYQQCSFEFQLGTLTLQEYIECISECTNNTPPSGPSN